MENTFELILLLLALAAGITAIAKKLNQPYPIALVVIGTFIGLVNIPALEHLKDFIAEDDVFRFAIISIFLPTLLGEATLKLPFAHLLENKKPILALAIGGTFISFLVTGFLSHQFLNLPLQVAFVFAALVAATDPVSVLSIFKSMSVDHRLETIMEGESLINDGVAVVLFSISSVYLLQYIELGWVGAAYGGLMFIKVVTGGLLIGSVLAYIFSILTRFYDDYPLEIIFSMLLFYGSFFIAEFFHVSGVIAVVIAGLIYGNYGAKIGMTPTTRLNIKTFWDVAALIANSLVFLMVGIEITRIDLSNKWGLILLSILIVLVARSIAVYSSLAFIRHIPYSWKHIFNWGGLKGSLSIALALSLPRDFPAREEVLVLSFSIVLFSLIVQGITIKPLVNMMGLKNDKNTHKDYEITISEIHRYMTGRQELQQMRQEVMINKNVYDQLDAQYQQKLDEAYVKLERLYEAYPDLHQEQMKNAAKQALHAEYDAINDLVKKNIISERIADEERKRVIELIER
jgi:CPA1 family monovalent cation:H+ antiporter